MNATILLLLIFHKTSQIENHGMKVNDYAIVLNSSNLMDFLNSHPYVFVKFFASWCSKCKDFQTTFSPLAKIYNEKKKGVVFAEMDADADKEFNEEFKIEHYPTNILFVYSHPIHYLKETSSEKISEWLNKILKRAPKKITKLNELQNLEKQISDQKNFTAFVLLITSEYDISQYEKYIPLSAELINLDFYYTSNEEIKKYLKTNSEYSLVVFRNFEERVKQMNEGTEMSIKRMKSFIDENRYPLVKVYDEEVAERVFKERKDVVFFFDTAFESEEFKIFEEVAEERKPFNHLIRVDLNTDIGKGLAKFFGLHPHEFRTVRLIRFEGTKPTKLKMSEAYSKKNLNTWLDLLSQDKLTPYKKSELEPKDNLKPVKRIVADTLDQFTSLKNESLLLLIYDNEDTRSLRVLKMIEAIAQQLVNVKDLIIGKINVLLNEHKDIEIRKAPVLKFFDANNNNVSEEYKGDLLLNEIALFIEKKMGRKLFQRKKKVKSDDL